MEPHVKNYLSRFGYSGFEFIPCEVCGAQAVDIHHVVRRSAFGSRNKKERDHPDNLVALCRECHDYAHLEYRDWQPKLKELIEARKMKQP